MIVKLSWLFVQEDSCSFKERRNSLQTALASVRGKHGFLKRAFIFLTRSSFYDKKAIIANYIQLIQLRLSFHKPNL